MQEDRTAFDMAEETITDSPALMRALDQPGDIRQHKFRAINPDHPELRMQRGEGIIGDFRAGIGCRREEGRFTGIWQAKQPGIGDQLQPEPDGALHRWLPRIGISRGLVGRCLEIEIAEPAIAAFGNPNTLPDFGQISDHRLFILVQNFDADRHFQDDILTITARALTAGTGAAIFGEEMLLIAIINQRIQPVHRLDDDITAAPAITPIRAAIFNASLPAEADAAIAARAGTNVNLGEIEKFHALPSCWNSSVKHREGAIAPRATEKTSPRPVSTKPAFSSRCADTSLPSIIRA